MTRHVATRAIAAGNALGEGIVWDTRDQSLYWTDIKAATLWRHCPASGATRTWPLPEPLGCLALCETDGWLLLGLASRLAFLELATGRIVPICPVEPGLATRINDGACDREGRFVFGTKHEPPGGGRSAPLGAFYRLDADLSLHRLALGGIAIANGTAFSPDGRTLYYCDSPTHVIRRCAYTRDGEARDAHDWIDLTAAEGEPDGSTVDADGGVWNARWDAGQVVRYDPAGHATDSVAFPVARPTRPALGGAGLATLFVTSAQPDAPSDNAGSDAGHVFSAHIAVPGLPEARFAGKPLHFQPT
ncbi:MAG TPA: SMP-30/gluconolactonase/LRE family protein [Rhodanobacteraceae bacterium]